MALTLKTSATLLFWDFLALAPIRKKERTVEINGSNTHGLASMAPKGKVVASSRQLVAGLAM